MSFSNKIPPTTDLPPIPNGHVFDGTEIIVVTIAGVNYTMTVTQLIAGLAHLGVS